MRAVNVRDDIWIVFDEQNDTQARYNATRLANERQRLVQHNNQYDISGRNAKLLEWAQANWILSNDGQIIERNKARIAEIDALLALMV